jgi:hypothetical protein
LANQAADLVVDRIQAMVLGLIFQERLLAFLR